MRSKFLTTSAIILFAPPQSLDQAQAQAQAQAASQPAPHALPPPPPPPASVPPPAVEPARPLENLASYVAPDDYPVAALRNNEEGTVGFRLTVDRDGRVTRCVITASSGSEALDSGTCRIMTERARFAAARDASGRPTEDRVSARISWRISADNGLAFGPVTMVRTALRSAEGSLSCSVELQGSVIQLAAADCGNVAMPPGTIGAAEYRMLGQFAPLGSDYAPVDSSNWGSLLAQAEAEVTIGPGGAMEECRVLNLVGTARNGPDFCTYVRGGALPSFESAAGPEPRRGRVRVSFYQRLGAPL